MAHLHDINQAAQANIDLTIWRSSSFCDRERDN
jgi:hypothetical protein